MIKLIKTLKLFVLTCLFTEKNELAQKNFFSSSYYLFKPSKYSIAIIIITFMLINITITGILEKSNGREFQGRNSNGMVYPYSPYPY